MKRTALLLLSAVAAAPAQTWVRVGPAPTWIHHVVYDRAAQRLLAIESGGTTWIFDGAQWRLPIPGGLEQLDVRSSLFAGYDEAQSEPVLATAGVTIYSNRTFVGRGAGWWQQFPVSAPDLFGAATATDPLTNALMLFGGRDRWSVYYDETAIRSGASWNAAAPATRPSPRNNAGLANDRARNRVVLFGGQDDVTVFGDTWEWDGLQWTQLAPVTAPTPRVGSLAYDPARQRVVQLGGFDGLTGAQDCWEWDGSQWLPRGNLPQLGSALGYDDGNSLLLLMAPMSIWRANNLGWSQVWAPSTPTPSSEPAFAYDPTRGETLLLTGQPSNETWSWDGTWQQRSATGPNMRGDAALAPLGTDMILFGGVDTSTWPIFALFDQTWSWDGQAWSLLQPAQRPPARKGHAMVSTGSELLLFGGFGAAGNLNDTWRFDGSTWLQEQPAASPPKRENHALAYDPVRQRAVLFGGWDPPSSLQDTWEWDGTNWLQQASSQSPIGGLGSATFDGAAGRVALPQKNGVWYWDGVDWSHVTALTVTHHGSGTTVFDEARQRLLLEEFGELHVFTPTPAAASLTYQVCGSQPDLRLLGRPVLGADAPVRLEGAASVPAAIVLGLQPTAIQWAPSCEQLVTIDATVFGATAANGRFQVPFGVPFDPGLRGVAILAQAVVLDGGPVSGLSLSSGLRFVVGD